MEVTKIPKQYVYCLICTGFLVFLGLTIFIGHLGDDFVHIEIFRNESLPDAFINIWLGRMYSDKADHNYRPVPNTLFMLQSKLSVHPGIFHVFSALLHGFSVIMLFRFIKHLGISPDTAIITSAIFLFYPGLMGAVLWSSAQADLLVSCFILTAAVCLLDSRRSLFLIFSCLAFLSKESSIAVIPIFILLIIERFAKGSRG
ncbi:hypothetical protein JW979_02895, partial [bacterium]|nr:hypothetical protein [candidate division CSSED10-310 bacterium]